MAKEKTNKKITLESLAYSIDGLRDHMDKRFEVIDERFTGIDKRFDSLDKSFEDLNEVASNSFNNLENQIVTKEEFKKLETKVERIDIRVDEIHEVTVGLEKGELRTGKSLRKLQKIVHRLSQETR